MLQTGKAAAIFRYKDRQVRSYFQKHEATSVRASVLSWGWQWVQGEQPSRGDAAEAELGSWGAALLEGPHKGTNHHPSLPLYHEKFGLTDVF